MKQEKFTKKELERLNCTKEDIELVMDYQNKLPIPNNNAKMSARILHSSLSVGRDFSTWITYKIKKYNFIKNIDYETHYESSDPKIGDADFTKLSKNQMSAMGIKKNIILHLQWLKNYALLKIMI